MWGQLAVSDCPVQGRRHWKFETQTQIMGINQNITVGLPWPSSGWDSGLPLQGTWVLTLVTVLRSWKLHSSVQFSHSVVSNSLRPHELHHARPPHPSPTIGVYSNSCPLSRWCHPVISSSAVPFSSCPQSLQASGSFPMSQLFASGGQSTGISASASVLPMNTQDWSPSGWTGWISLLSKGLSRVFSNTTVQKHQFFSTQLSSQSNSHIHTWPLEKPEPSPDGPLLAK